MRFVKNLIATAALATVVLQGGVAGLPAGGNLNLNLDKRSTVVPGASTTTASIPVRSSPGAIITTESDLPGASVSARGGAAISVWEGSGGHVTLTGMPTRRDELTHTVTESSESVFPTDHRVSVSLVTFTESSESESVPTSSTGAEVDAQVTYLPKPPVGPIGNHPDALIEARQMLPMPSSSSTSISALSQRQMLPMPSPSTTSVSALSQRQMLPMPLPSTTVIDARGAVAPPRPPFGRQPNPNVQVEVAAGAEAAPSSPYGRQPNLNPDVQVEVAAGAEASPSTPYGRQPDPKVAGGEDVVMIIPAGKTVNALDQDPTFSVDPSDLPPRVTARDQDPTFSVDPSDLPGAAITARDQEASITLTASYTITITEVPTPSVTARDQDPTFSVDPSDLPPRKTARDQDPTFSVDPSDLPPAMTTTKRPGPPHNTPPAITARDQDPTFSVDPTDLPPRAVAVTWHDQDPIDVPPRPTKTMMAREQEAQAASITLTASYTITLTEPLDVPTTLSAMSAPEAGPLEPRPPFTGGGGDGAWVDPPVPTGAAAAEDVVVVVDTTYEPINSHTYTHTRHPTTLVTSVASAAA